MPRNKVIIRFEPKDSLPFEAEFYVSDQSLSWVRDVAIAGSSVCRFYLLDAIPTESIPVGLVGELTKNGQDYKVTVLEWREYPSPEFYPCFIGQMSRRIYSY